MSRLIPARCVVLVLCVFAPSLARAAAPASAVPAVGSAEDSAWLPANGTKLPRWRGFNLLEMFYLKRREPFHEDDFRLISKFGFNFVRLPMDYRCWIKDGNWERFDEDALKEVDRAIEMGRRYHIHVCLNFHRAPGYTVAKPPEERDLWTDTEAQRVCGLHWATFARRYKGIPSSRLSFNLLNEPKKIDPAVFVPVIRKLVEAIRAEDPDRLIISDGLEWGGKPVLELGDLHIAQAARGYAPMEISHFKASWVKSENYRDPAWPQALPIPGMLAVPSKPETNHLLTIEGPFGKAVALRLHVEKVSVAADLVVEADGVKVFEKSFKCGPGDGEWKKAEFSEKWKVYQNIYDKDYVARIPAGTSRVLVRVVGGDWLQVSELGFKADGAGIEHVLQTKPDFHGQVAPFRYAPQDPLGPFVGLPMQDKRWHREEILRPWLAAREQGIGVIVGEWGAYNKTPHDVVLRWAEDCLDNWKQADIGWAMWNFRGSFGVLDSGRADVQYEDLEGHKLDRKLMDLLQKY